MPVIDASSVRDEMERAIACQRAGHAAEAEAIYRRVIDAQPGLAVANHNLAVLLAQRGDIAAALPFFARAVTEEPGQEIYWLSHARGLIAGGHAEEAVALLDHARARGHDTPRVAEMVQQARAGAPSAEAADRMGQALLDQGRPEAAVAAFERALAIDPDFADAHFHLGSLLSECGEVARGFTHFMRRAALIAGDLRSRSGDDLPHKLKHDAEQRAYLGKAGFHIADGARLDGPAVDPSRAAPGRFAAWDAASPPLLVIDDFLTPAALSRLRDYCAGSTIWKRVYTAGYIGATPEDGFACPLLAQIIEETQALYAPILGDHAFRYLGGFKYDSALSTGTNTHADNSAINLNLYITPDEANLDPASGGMEIWDAAPEDEAAMRRYNGDEAAARDFLRRTGARSTIVPHRANRAIFFRSDLMHKTDNFRFAEGYLNKRINVSMLFGQRGG
jgi:tetratricopeptide (TPR) repeat protein